MRLQFLINHYNEPQEMVKRLLDSIAMQNGLAPNKDYNVLICSDRTDNVLDKGFLNSFPFHIEYEALPHRGVCATRNTLLDKASADYIMFCDADDCFHSPEGAAAILRVAEESGADFVSAPFLEEEQDGDSFRRKSNNLTFIHSKLFRRAYLMENDIRFPGEVESAGDMTFVWWAFHKAKTTRSIMETYYTWKYHEQSVTRILPFKGVRFYGNEVRAFALLTRKLIARGERDLYNKLVATIISTAYLDTRIDGWAKAPSEYVENAKKAIAEYVHEFASYYYALDKKQKFRAYNNALLTRRTYGPADGFSGIEDWVREVFHE